MSEPEHPHSPLLRRVGMDESSRLINRVYEVLVIARRYHARDRETLASILKFPMKQVPILNLVSRIMPVYILSPWEQLPVKWAILFFFF